MGASYDTALVAAKDQVRHLVGDIDTPANAQLTDEEIAYELAQAGNVVRTAALACCHRLRARYAVLADSTEGDVSKKWSQLFAHFGELAESLADTSAGGAAAAVAPAYAGGTSLSDVQARELDLDRAPNAFGGRFGGAGYPFGPRSPWGW